MDYLRRPFFPWRKTTGARDDIPLRGRKEALRDADDRRTHFLVAGDKTAAGDRFKGHYERASSEVSNHIAILSMITRTGATTSGYNLTLKPAVAEPVPSESRYERNSDTATGEDRERDHPTGDRVPAAAE